MASDWIVSGMVVLFLDSGIQGDLRDCTATDNQFESVTQLTQRGGQSLDLA